jgi:hypothetical protein
MLARCFRVFFAPALLSLRVELEVPKHLTGSKQENTHRTYEKKQKAVGQKKGKRGV